MSPNRELLVRRLHRLERTQEIIEGYSQEYYRYMMDRLIVPEVTFLSAMSDKELFDFVFDNIHKDHPTWVRIYELFAQAEEEGLS